ncbi:alpha/beta hydrolase [Paenirhodobacter populi]|nr:alpha/beta hydrolase-fold protein [Sinirhodobacter populi]
MKRFSRRSVLCASAALLWADRSAAQPDAGPTPQAGQRGDTIPAEVIGDPRVETFDLGPARAPWRIFVGRPRGSAPAGGYSVIFALDGNASFPLLWHAREALAPEAPVVIVGIGYPTPYRFDADRRYLDLTPLTPPGNFGGRRSDRATGGRKVFLDFIEGELSAEIVRRLPVDPARRSLFGHSLGGLFTLHALYERPHLFSGYIAADPSIWWNKGSILAEEARFRENLTAAPVPPIRLLMENSGGERRAASDPRSDAAFSGRLAAERLAGTGRIEVFYRVFPDETHPSMLGPAIADGLLFHLGHDFGAGTAERMPVAVRRHPGQ